ncbi:MAG: hypothetical protein M3Q50_10905 [Chloroflexota bacterium]|nr:hypothetical protein [Chloroflexota bacterium]
MHTEIESGNAAPVVERLSSRRAMLATSLTLAAGAIVAVGAFESARVAAQDDSEGIGAGGRQGGDGGGGGRRQRQQEGEEAAAGVGSGGRSGTLPTVTDMPSTGVGDMNGGLTGVAPLLLAAGAVGAATVAMTSRSLATADSEIR